MTDETIQNAAPIAPVTVLTPADVAAALPAGTKSFDVSEETYREYVYPNGDVFAISQPVALYITADLSHRVVDYQGVTHRPNRGFVGIRWKQANGLPFSF